jgi:hypothetical protein
MALSLKFIGIKWRYGECSIEQIPGEFGVNATSFLQPSTRDPRFREVHVKNDGYFDCYAVLSPSEALELARLHPSGTPLQQIEAALYEVNIVVAHVFEWETGLDLT